MISRIVLSEPKSITIYGAVSLIDGCHEPPFMIISVPLIIVELNEFSRADWLAENDSESIDDEDLTDTAARKHSHFATRIKTGVITEFQFAEILGYIQLEILSQSQ